jgi:hypothetical protein
MLKGTTWILFLLIQFLELNFWAFRPLDVWGCPLAVHAHKESGDSSGSFYEAPLARLVEMMDRAPDTGAGANNTEDGKQDVVKMVFPEAHAVFSGFRATTPSLEATPSAFLAMMLKYARSSLLAAINARSSSVALA